MKKTFACAFVLFMFASTTTALAGDKRFCGWVWLDGGAEGNTNVAAGSWFDKGDISFGKYCKASRKEAKEYLKEEGEWEGGDWKKKDGYKCGNVSDNFRGGKKGICGTKGYMKKEGGTYMLIKIGDEPAEVTKRRIMAEDIDPGVGF